MVAHDVPLAPAVWGRTIAEARTTLASLGLAPGERVVIALPAGAAIAPLIAAWALDLVPAPVPAGDDLPLERHAATLDASAVWAVPAPPRRVARADRPPSPTGGAVLLRTSGSVGDARWVLASAANVGAVLASHRDALDMAGGHVLSSLPPTHVFGLVLEQVAALLAAATVTVVPTGARDLDALLARGAGVTHAHAVPTTIRRLATRADGRAWLTTLRGGLVGGATITPDLVPVLTATRLRVGYGQTEASPGITLGAPGEFADGWIGRAIGCEVRREDDRLWVRGPNVALGTWRDGTWTPFAPGAWLDTGDYATPVGDGWRFDGRAADDFKLANGRRVAAGRLEAAVRAAAPVETAMLWSPDGDALAWSLTPRAGATVPPSVLRDVLGPLAARLAAVHVVPATAWRRTPKGDLDRRVRPLADA